MKAAKDAEAGVVVWVDFMKYGVVSATELNNTIDLVSKSIALLPDRAVCFMVAPQITSERRSGLRDEWRQGRINWNLKNREVTTLKFWTNRKIICHVYHDQTTSNPQDTWTYINILKSTNYIKLTKSIILTPGGLRTKWKRKGWLRSMSTWDANHLRQANVRHFCFQVGFACNMALLTMCSVGVPCCKTGAASVMLLQLLHKKQFFIGSLFHEKHRHSKIEIGALLLKYCTAIII